MKITIPTKLSDITLEQVQKVLLIEQNPDIEAFPKMVHSLAVLTGMSATEVGQIHYLDLEKIYDKSFAMISGLGDAPLIRRVSYLGREYAFIEDVRDMETGAFVDIDAMAKGEEYAKNLHKIMAILYRPIEAELGGKYRLRSYVKEDPRERDERAAIFLKHMTFDVVRGAAGFFLLVTQKSLNILDGSFPIQAVKREVNKVIGGGIT